MREIIKSTTIIGIRKNKQVVIAGEKEAVTYACELLKEAGAKRALVLPVSVPSHCSLMKDAANEFKDLDLIFEKDRIYYEVEFDGEIIQSVRGKGYVLLLKS